MLQFIAPLAIGFGVVKLIEFAAKAVSEIAEDHYEHTERRYHRVRQQNEARIRHKLDNATRYREMQRIKILRDESAAVAQEAFQQYVAVLKNIDDLWKVESQISRKIDELKKEKNRPLSKNDRKEINRAISMLIQSSKEAYQRRRQLLTEKNEIKAQLDHLNSITQSYRNNIHQIAGSMR
jgi:hypothetical protein